MSVQTLARTLHDLGLAAWFGGSLMGVIGINAAARSLADPQQRITVSTAGWTRWRPVNAAAIIAYLAGAAELHRTATAPSDGKRRSRTWRVVAGGSALSAAAYSRALEHKIQHAGRVPPDSTGPVDDTPPAVADAQVTLRALQWAVPTLTGALIAGNTRQRRGHGATSADPARSISATAQDPCAPPAASITSAPSGTAPWRVWRSASAA